MLRPILIVLLVTLSKLHSGDSVVIKSPEHRSVRRISTSPAPPPQRTPPSSSKGRLGSVSIPEPKTSRSSSFNANSAQQAASSSCRNRLVVPGSPASQPQSPKSTYIPNKLPPGVIMISVDKDGNPLSPIPEGYSYVGGAPNRTGGTTEIIDWMEQEKRQEEENNAIGGKINTEGETIQQRLPSGDGDIVIKISGTNINQRNMNKLREYMKNAIGFVFENTTYKSAIMARYM